MTRRERGFALLVVLWTLGLLALLGTQFVAAGRADMSLAGNLRAAAMVEAATSGAIQQAVFQLLQQGPGGWRANGGPYQVRIGGTQVTIGIADEGDRLNPNLADQSVLTALLGQVGADPNTAAAVAAAILDWRTGGDLARPGGAKAPQYSAAGRAYGPPNAPFRGVDELGLVLGMTPALLERLRPHLTVFTDFAPLGDSSDPIVAAALRVTAPAGAPPAGGDLGDIAVARITATGRGPDDAAVTLRAIVRLNATPDGLPFEILFWQTVDG